LVEDADDVRHFRSKFAALMADIRNQGYSYFFAPMGALSPETQYPRVQRTG
jgi:hypothetical protein